MPIKRITPKANIRQFLDREIERRQQVIVNEFIKIGLEAQGIARTVHKYQTQTGNLASSIGWCVLVNGEPVQTSGFEVVKDGAEGSQSGKDFLNKLAQENPIGIVLIMVAGMRYAKYVEAKGLDVLDSAELFAERKVKELPNVFKKLGI